MRSDEERIMRTLSPVEVEMLQDQIDGTVMPRTQACWTRTLKTVPAFKGKAEQKRIEALIDAAERHVAEERAKVGVIHSAKVDRAHLEHNPTAVKKCSRKPGIKAKVAA